jgi:glycerol kinase
MEADAGLTTGELAVDGGASQNDWLMQFQADMLGIPVRRPQLVETTALGAAGLAGIATGVWGSAAEFLSARSAPSRFEPSLASERRAELMHGWHRAVAAALSWADAR